MSYNYNFFFYFYTKIQPYRLCRYTFVSLKSNIQHDKGFKNLKIYSIHFIQLQYSSAGLSHFMSACAGSNSSIAAEYLRLTQHRPWTSLDDLVNSKVLESSNSPYRGYTPLHFAAEFGRFDTVQLLLAHGASCFVLTADKLTPLIVSLKRGHGNICCLLWNRYKAYRQGLFKIFDKADRQIIESEGSSPSEVKNRVLASPLNSTDGEQQFDEVESLNCKGKKGQEAPN